MQASFRKSLIVAGLALGAAVVGGNASAGEGDNLSWQSVVGIVQANNIVGTGTGAVTGAPGPWSALGGHVNVNLGKGLIDFNPR